MLDNKLTHIYLVFVSFSFLKKVHEKLTNILTKSIRDHQDRIMVYLRNIMYNIHVSVCSCTTYYSD